MSQREEPGTQSNSMALAELISAMANSRFTITERLTAYNLLMVEALLEGGELDDAVIAKAVKAFEKCLRDGNAMFNEASNPGG